MARLVSGGVIAAEPNKTTNFPLLPFWAIDAFFKLYKLQTANHLTNQRRQ